MNHVSLRRALVVVPAVGSVHVMVGDTVWGVEPFSWTRNCGSVLAGAGIGVGFRHGVPPKTRMPALTVTPGGRDEESHVPSTGSGSVAATNRLNSVALPDDELCSEDGSGAVVRAFAISEES